MIKGINHLTFSVSNLDVSISFYKQVFGANLLFRDERTVYFDLAGLWLALNVQDNIPRTEIRQSYTHVAFTIDVIDMAEMTARLQRLDVALLPDRPRGESEGQSLYFADPDSHLLEVHTGSLATRLQAYYSHEIVSTASE